MNRPLRLVSGLLLLSLILVGQGCGGNEKKVDDTAVVPEPKEKGFTLVLVPNSNADDLKCKLSKGLKPDEDHVRWYNQTTTEVEITFTVDWPFLEPTTDKKFTVAAGAYSPYFSLNRAKPNTDYPYATVPNVVDPGTGPGEPGVSIGD